MKVKDMLKLPMDQAGLPVIARLNGFSLQLTPEHLQEVERLVSVGASKKYVARALLCSERELDKAIESSPVLEKAIQDGAAMDEFVLAGKLRSMAMDGEFNAMQLYLKAKHGWRDRDAAASGGGAGPSININITGLLEKGITIDGNANTSDL